MSKRTIIFRSDGSSSIGMGHFTRTLALAEMLNEHFQCLYATRQPSDYQIAEIKKVCHGHIDLPEDDSHFERFLENLIGDEIVVLDNYYFSTEYQKTIKEIGCKLVCIDDIHDKHYVADIVINHAEKIDISAYSAEPYTKFLLGFEYALIRKEFRKQTDSLTVKEFSFVIIMGGTDPYGLTGYFLELTSNLDFKKPIAVVSPFDVRYKNTIWFNNINAFEVSMLMEKSEFGLFPASTLAIEACAKRLPFICGYLADNQANIYKGIEEYELAICVGNFNTLNKELFQTAISKIMNRNTYLSIVNRQKKTVDNLVGDRFIKAFTSL